MPNLENMLDHTPNPHKLTPRLITEDGRIAPDVQGFGGATSKLDCFFNGS